MSLIKILPEYLETFSLRLHPKVNYLSSSYSASTSLTTGSMPVSARPSKCFKNIIDPSQIGQNSYDVNSPGVVGFNEGDYEILEEIRSANDKVKDAVLTGIPCNVSGTMQKYMNLVNSSSQIAKNTKRFEIVRFDPPFTFTKNSTVKNITRKVLMPYYMPSYDMCQFGYTNYNTINFFTGSTVPSNSVILYPNFNDIGGGVPSGRRPYSPSGSFTIDFYINPRYTNDVGRHYHAGTILHLSSTYAVSLISGTLTDNVGSAGSFRILLQLSHSADVPPEKIDLTTPNNLRTYPQDLAFVSDDHKILKNNWHHVGIRWGGQDINAGTGSIIIDDHVNSFSIPSSSILPPANVVVGALAMGNYLTLPSERNESKFFNETSALAEGVFPYIDFGGTEENADPPDYRFKNPLLAEIHDVKIYDRYLSHTEILENAAVGRSNTNDEMLFYVPPYFTKECRTRDSLITPFQTERKKPEHPFNVSYSFGVGGFMMNLQNHLREFKRGAFPRLLNLSASTIDYTVLDITANGHSFGTGSMRKRNLTILPNDNGLFTPDYSLLKSGSVNTSMSSFRHVLGGYDLSMISVDTMVPPGAAFSGLSTVSAEALREAWNNESVDLPDDTSNDTLAAQIAGVSPQSMGSGSYVGPILTIYQRTRDPSSNEISIFDISNLFYGNRIAPDSFYLTDNNLSGSGGKVQITLKDNGKGGLYRADALTPHPTWANVGTILYNEGVVVIKNPALSYFGKREFEAQFEGEQNAHILTINMPAETGMINSSSNPQYKLVSASLNPNEYDPNFVYLTGFNLHDDNLNVIMRGNLAQPIKKRMSDEMLIRFKMDF